MDVTITESLKDRKRSSDFREQLNMMNEMKKESMRLRAKAKSALEPMAITFDAKITKPELKLEVSYDNVLPRPFLDDNMDIAKRSRLPALVIKGSGKNEMQPLDQNNKMLRKR